MYNKGQSCILFPQFCNVDAKYVMRLTFSGWITVIWTDDRKIYNLCFSDLTIPSVAVKMSLQTYLTWKLTQ